MTTTLIDAMLTNGRSALADLDGASPGGGFVTSRPAYGPQITPGDIVRYAGAWTAVTEASHDGILGLTWLALIDADGRMARHMMASSDVIDRRTDVRLDPATLYKLADRTCAARYRHATTAPGAAAGGVDDAQLAAWIDAGGGPGLDERTVDDLHDVEDLAGLAVQVLDEHNATHPIRDIAVWPLGDGTGEALITVDHPAGVRVSTLTIRPAAFAGHTYREALGILLAIARAAAGRLDALVAAAGRLQAQNGPQAPRRTCKCPPGTQAMIGDVLVTGHTPECTDGEPRRYVWQESGTFGTGTLADYAQSWAMARDDSLPGADLGEELRTWEASYCVVAESLAATPDQDGCWPVRLSVPGEQVTVRVWALTEPAPPAATAAGDGAGS